MGEIDTQTNESSQSRERRVLRYSLGTYIRALTGDPDDLNPDKFLSSDVLSHLEAEPIALDTVAHTVWQHARQIQQNEREQLQIQDKNGLTILYKDATHEEQVTWWAEQIADNTMQLLQKDGAGYVKEGLEALGMKGSQRHKRRGYKTDLVQFFAGDFYTNRCGNDRERSISSMRNDLQHALLDEVDEDKPEIAIVHYEAVVASLLPLFNKMYDSQTMELLEISLGCPPAQLLLTSQQDIEIPEDEKTHLRNVHALVSAVLSYQEENTETEADEVFTHDERLATEEDRIFPPPAEEVVQVAAHHEHRDVDEEDRVNQIEDSPANLLPPQIQEQPIVKERSLSKIQRDYDQILLRDLPQAEALYSYIELAGSIRSALGQIHSYKMQMDALSRLFPSAGKEKQAYADRINKFSDEARKDFVTAIPTHFLKQLTRQLSTTMLRLGEGQGSYDEIDEFIRDVFAFIQRNSDVKVENVPIRVFAKEAQDTFEEAMPNLFTEFLLQQLAPSFDQLSQTRAHIEKLLAADQHGYVPNVVGLYKLLAQVAGVGLYPQDLERTIEERMRYMQQAPLLYFLDKEFGFGIVEKARERSIKALQKQLSDLENEMHKTTRR